LVGDEYNRIIVDLFPRKGFVGEVMMTGRKRSSTATCQLWFLAYAEAGGAGEEEGVDAPAGWVMDNGVPRLIGRIKAKCGGEGKKKTEEARKKRRRRMGTKSEAKRRKKNGQKEMGNDRLLDRQMVGSSKNGMQTCQDIRKMR
jgi:hypothetical protein